MNEVLNNTTDTQKTIEFLLEDGNTPLDYQRMLIKLSAGMTLTENEQNLLIDLHSFLGLLTQ